MLQQRPLKVPSIFHLEYTMNKETILHAIYETLTDLPLIYAYVGGSFNTPLRHPDSDVDLFLIWETKPSKTTRKEILNRLETNLKNTVEWTHLDKDGDIMLDAIKVKNHQKVEIYHNSFRAFEYTLNNQELLEGLSFSIYNRLPLISQPTIEKYIESYRKAWIKELRNLHFSIMSAYQNKKANQNTQLEIIKMFSIHKYGAVPSKKHFDRTANEIPDKTLLASSTSSWIEKHRQTLYIWGKASPVEMIEVNSTTVLQKQKSDLSLAIFEKVKQQKERLEEFLTWPVHINTLEDQMRFSDKADFQWQEGQAYHFQILENSVFAGAISIHSMNYLNRSFEFGYWVDKAFEGRGLVHQNLQALIAEMANKGWKQAKIRSSQGNIRSQKVAEKLGMNLDSRTEHFNTYSLQLKMS